MEMSDRFLDGKHDFQQRERVDAQVFDEPGAVAGGAEVLRALRGEVALDDAVDDGGNLRRVARGAEADGGLHGVRAATFQGGPEVDEVLFGRG